MSIRLYKKIFVSTKLKCITGLHIGDSKDSVEIGGIDNTVVRRKDQSNQPYIPGSSLKGKIRSLLEQIRGENPDGKSQNNGGDICKLFGASNSDDNGQKIEGIQSRIIVRDADLTPETVTMLNDSDFTDMPFTEVKFENTINRIRGTADNPRKQERVPAGSYFQVSFIINVFASDDNEAKTSEKLYLKLLFEGMELLEDDYLGGSGSRGYGQVEFCDLQIYTKEFILKDIKRADENTQTQSLSISLIKDYDIESIIKDEEATAEDTPRELTYLAKISSRNYELA